MMNKLFAIFCHLVMLLTVQSKLAALDEDIGQAIFHENEAYLIYVCDHTNEKIFTVIEQYCQHKLCAYIDSTMEEYERLNDFIGLNHKHYLLILDVAKMQKYVHPIHEVITNSQINQFHSNFLKGQLTRYLSSEPIPQDDDSQIIRKLVGQTVNAFLQQPTPIKVIYLYTNDQLCSNCFEIYQQLEKLATKLRGEDWINFGFIDIFKNENEFIKTAIVPQALVFRGQDYKKPMMIEADQIAQLETIIYQLKDQISGDL